jgi:hypothetical protein
MAPLTTLRARRLLDCTAAPPVALRVGPSWTAQPVAVRVGPADDLAELTVLS